MNMILRASVAAALLSVASVSAFATTVAPPASNTGLTPTSDPTNGSGLLVQVFDAATGHSFTEWLGYNFTNFLPSAQTPAGGETLDFGILGGSTAWNAFVANETTAAGAAGPNLQFTVEAGSNSAFPNQLEVTLANGPPTAVNNSGLQAAVGSLNQAITGMTAAAQCNNANPCIANSATDAGYLASTMGPNGGGHLGSGSTAAAALGSSLGFYLLTASSTSTLGKPTAQQYSNAAGMATWTLSSNGDLVYNVPGASATPLPAGVWLLGSGLLGLFGVGRRNRAAA